MDPEPRGGEELPCLEMLGICKTYPENNVHANQDVHFSVREGEIHALVGENGAGKTSLMKILCGLERADKGEIRLRGAPVRIGSTRDAEKLGIGMVHQQFSLVESFSVTDNIVLNREPLRALFLYNRAKAKRDVEELSRSYGFHVEPDALVESLSAAGKQRVEILRILYRGSRILGFSTSHSCICSKMVPSPLSHTATPTSSPVSLHTLAISVNSLRS